MEYVIKGKKPEQIFRYFEEISAIPRGSGDEATISAYIDDFAAARGLEHYRDRVNNVFVRMPASAGRENEAPVLFQAHTDMVCEKNEGTVHDFLHDGLELYVENGWLHARGTTLGADDGIGVAIMLAILDGTAESHPPVECLFTVSEETGMDGMNNFDFSKITARKLVNLDAAGCETVIAGCAGGVRCNLAVRVRREDADGEALAIRVSGLAGGHSGENINDGRANAIKLMGRILMALEPVGFRLSSLDGGGKSNAIPRECRAVIVTEKAVEAEKIIKKVAAEIAAELDTPDVGYTVEVTKPDARVRPLDELTTAKTVALLGVVANGVLKMSRKIAGFVEYSRNLGVVVTKDEGIVFTFFARSAINAQLDDNCRELETLAALCGATVEYSERYGGWDFKADSPLREEYCRAYSEVSGKVPVVESIHAGLECGYVIEQVPDMDIISIGPNEIDIHSPDERLELSSVEFLWDVLEKMMK